MASEPTLWGVPVSLAALNACLTAGVILIAGGRSFAAIVFIPLHVALRRLCERQANLAHQPMKET